jgi:hypothetical protein
VVGLFGIVTEYAINSVVKIDLCSLLKYTLSITSTRKPLIEQWFAYSDNCRRYFPQALVLVTSIEQEKKLLTKYFNNSLLVSLQSPDDCNNNTTQECPSYISWVMMWWCSSKEIIMLMFYCGDNQRTKIG